MSYFNEAFKNFKKVLNIYIGIFKIKKRKVVAWSLILQMGNTTLNYSRLSYVNWCLLGMFLIYSIQCLIVAFYIQQEMDVI